MSCFLLKSLPSVRAAGPDSLRYDFLRGTADSISVPLLLLFNECIRSGTILEKLTFARMSSFLDANSSLPFQQFGFQSSRRCCQQLLLTRDFISKGFDMFG